MRLPAISASVTLAPLSWEEPMSFEPIRGWEEQPLSAAGVAHKMALKSKEVQGFAITAPVLPNLTEIPSLTLKGKGSNSISPLNLPNFRDVDNISETTVADGYLNVDAEGGSDTIIYNFDESNDTITRGIDGGTSTGDIDTFRFNDFFGVFEDGHTHADIGAGTITHFGPNNDAMLAARFNNIERLYIWGFTVTANGTSSGNYIIVDAYYLSSVSGYGGNDTLIGGSAFERDHLEGGDGNDDLSGNDGVDKLYGDNHNDTLSGGYGDDSLFGGSGTDKLYGGNDFDVLYGDSGNDELHGGTGNDRFYGGRGEDTIYGGDGVDRYFLPGEDDDEPFFHYCDLNLVKGTSKVISTSGDILDQDFLSPANDIEIFVGTLATDDMFGNGLNNTFFGMAGNDQLYGAGGNDKLDGGSGQDEINGEAGNDTLWGGTGPDVDTFIYGRNWGTDTIKDFGSEDKLNISAMWLGYNSINDFAHEVIDNRHTYIYLDSGTTVILENYTGLNDGDFIFWIYP